jgi:hypothetical protein
MKSVLVEKDCELSELKQKLAKQVSSNIEK